MAKSRSEGDAVTPARPAGLEPVASSRAFFDGLPRTMPWLRSAVTNAVALAIPCWAFWRLTWRTIATGSALGYEDQFYLWGGWSIGKGLIPYRDFASVKPPMPFLAHALALALFGEHVRYAFLLLGLLAIGAFTASFLWRGADALFTSVLGVAVAFRFTSASSRESFFSNAESIAFSFYLLAVSALVAKTRRRRLVEVMGGMLLAAAASSNGSLLPCVFATWATSGLVVALSDRAHARRYVVNTAMGAAAVAVPLALYLVPTGGLSAYLATARAYSASMVAAGQEICAAFGSPHPGGRWMVDLDDRWDRLRGDYLNAGALGSVAPLIVASLVFLPRRSWALGGMAFLALGLALRGAMVRHCSFPHDDLAADAGLSFFLALGVDAIGSSLAVAGAVPRLFLRAAVLLPVALAVWPSLTDGLPPTSIVPSARSEPPAGVLDFVREHSGPKDKVFTTGPPGFYVRANRLAAAREGSLLDAILPGLPGHTDADKLRPLYEELVQSRPKIVILDPEHASEKRRHLTSAVLPFLAEFHYQKLNDFIYLRP